MTKTKRKIDFTKAPYKGILSEVARELNITQSAVSQAVHIYKTTSIIQKVAQKVAERNNAINQFENTYII